jgi:hypothetical protein
MEAILDQFFPRYHEKGNLKMAAFRDIALWIIALMMEAVRNPETWVYYNESTQRYIPEAVIFILAAVSTWKFAKGNFFSM